MFDVYVFEVQPQSLVYFLTSFTWSCCLYRVYMVQRPLGCEIKVKYLYTLNIVGEKHIYIQRLFYLGRFCGFSS